LAEHDLKRLDAIGHRLGESEGDLEVVRDELFDLSNEERLRVLRTGAGLSQAELARQIDAGDHTVPKWEYGDRTISAEYLLRLVRVFDEVYSDFRIGDLATPSDDE